MQERRHRADRARRTASAKSLEKRRKEAGRVRCWLQQAQKLAALNGLEEVVDQLSRAGGQARGTNELRVLHQHSYWG